MLNLSCLAWVNNCIGHHNLAHFYRFLFYVDLACTYHIYLISYTIFEYRYREFSELYTGFLIANYATCLPVLLAVGLFSLYHFWCLCTNTTTIEGWEKDKAAVLMRKGRIKEIRYPYDLGCMSNIRAILGQKMLWWCWPQHSTGDGLTHPTGKNVSKWLSSLDEEVRPHEEQADLQSMV